MKPSDFTNYPWNSILQKSECETVAQNIMKILKRTGNKFRALSFNEYKTERLKDSNFTEGELSYFDQVNDYCTDGESALRFCSNWAK